MRYDWRDSVSHEEFSRGFFDEIDRRFFGEAEKYMPWEKMPFEALIDFPGIANKDVLEIGVGNGSHAQLLAATARSFTGIDLTDYAVKSTSERLKLRGLKGRVERMDAEKLTFPDNSFDLIWTWGVIHHSSNTAGILREMHRVLRPGGTATVMVYHRNFWNYYVMAGLFHGMLRGELLKKRSLHSIMQGHTDGAIARYYTGRDWNALVAPWFDSVLSVYGGKQELFPLPAGRVKQAIVNAVPNPVTRFFTNRCRMGTFLVSQLRVKK